MLNKKTYKNLYVSYKNVNINIHTHTHLVTQ